jgi:RHS repeat-associated protein
MKRFLLVLLLAAAAPPLLAVDDHNPIGVTGAFEGVITTGCAYNVLNHSATRQIDDIVVPGSIGKYPLKMTRYYNSRGFGDGWSREYAWAYDSLNGKYYYPNGNVWDSSCTGEWGLSGPLGVSDGPTTWNGSPAFRLADGGTIVFGDARWTFGATKIIDPYGQITTITLDSNSGRITRVTEPGGRYLQFTYNGLYLLTQVDAYDGQGNWIENVVYHYTAIRPAGGGTSGTPFNCLTSVDYTDGTHAYYAYQDDNVPDHPGPPCPCSIKVWPLLRTCQDVRYKGPMRHICYEYQDHGPHGAIIAERYSLNGSTNGPRVSRIDPPAPSPIVNDPNFETTYTEYRGDGPTRTFTYTPLHLTRREGDGMCPTWTQNPTSNPAPQQFLTDYTDFRGNSTHLGYDPNWYVNSVRDANMHTTSYVRGSPPLNGVGEILTITHPGGSHIDYTYDDHGHYVHTVSNERQKVTTYTRHPTTHLVTRIDYPQDGNTPASFEEFTYNGFGEVLNHHLKNGAWEHFDYDTRGLLTDKYNPKQTGVPGGGDPHTHYTYYTSGSWTDRVRTMTLPANVSGFSASETYEYDREFDNNGVTNLNGAAVGGRGLVTKITHADGKYQRFKHDRYGNKVWEDNELRKATNYAYDDYNRLTSVTNPLNNTETFDYLKPGTTSPSVHTTDSVYTHTSRAGIVTTNVYDQNWRKTSTVVASGTLNLTTGFAYDLVGNLTEVTDPRGKIAHSVYDNRNRKTQTTEASNTSLAVTTVWHYDPASNINQIDRPDGIHETKGYDALNRMIWHTVPRQVPGQQGTIYLTTRITYDPSGTIDHVTDPRGKLTSFHYNASDERITMTYPGGTQSQSWVYDNAHNLASRTTVAGGTEIQRFYYDIRNRKIQMRWDNTADWANYGYDGASHLTSANNSNSSVTRHYDDAGRLDWEQQNVTGLGSTKTVNYPGYDNDGRLTNMNVTGASYDYTYSYDAAGRFEKIKLTSNGSVQFQYAYDAASNEIDRYANLPNNVQIQQHYYRDSLNRMGSRVIRKNGTTIAGTTEAYTYDHMNRITEVNRGGVVDDFGYYWSGELLSAQYGGGPDMPYTEGQDPDLDTTDNNDPNAGYQPPDQEAPEPTPPPEDYADLDVGGFVPPALPTGHSVTYYLDRAGNRQQVTDSASPTASYVTNNINQYSSVSGCSITNGPEHEVSDFRGPSDPGQVHYTYINDEHLTTVSDGPNIYNLYYDALGRCVKRALNGTTTFYIYDGEKPIVEYNSSNTIIARTVYGKGIDEVLMRKETGINDGNWFYYAQDHEGSVTHLLDGRSTPSSQTGTVIERYLYDAFGAPTFLDASGNPLNPNCTAYNNRFLFTGREYAATYRGIYVQSFQFYEYRARAYNPILGRFMSEDPKLFVRRPGLGASSADWTFAAHPDEAEFNLFRYCGNDPVDFTDPMGLDTMANAMAVAEAGVPGQYEYNQMATSFQSGNYGMAAGWGVTWVCSTVVGVLSGTNSTRLQAGLRAAESAAARRTVVAVIGKYLDTPSYVDVGKHLNKNVLNVSTKLWERMSPDQKWAATQKFLDNMIAHKGDLLFNKSIKSIASQSGDFRRELDYVSQKGYVLSQDGWSMTRVVEDASTASRHVPLPTNP